MEHAHRGRVNGLCVLAVMTLTHTAFASCSWDRPLEALHSWNMHRIWNILYGICIVPLADRRSCVAKGTISVVLFWSRGRIVTVYKVLIHPSSYLLDYFIWFLF